MANGASADCGLSLDYRECEAPDTVGVNSQIVWFAPADNLPVFRAGDADWKDHAS